MLDRPACQRPWQAIAITTLLCLFAISDQGRSAELDFCGIRLARIAYHLENEKDPLPDPRDRWNWEKTTIQGKSFYTFHNGLNYRVRIVIPEVNGKDLIPSGNVKFGSILMTVSQRNGDKEDSHDYRIDDDGRLFRMEKGARWQEIDGDPIIDSAIAHFRAVKLPENSAKQEPDEIANRILLAANQRDEIAQARAASATGGTNTILPGDPKLVPIPKIIVAGAGPDHRSVRMLTQDPATAKKEEPEQKPPTYRGGLIEATSSGHPKAVTLPKPPPEVDPRRIIASWYGYSSSGWRISFRKRANGIVESKLDRDFWGPRNDPYTFDHTEAPIKNKASPWSIARKWTEKENDQDAKYRIRVNGAVEKLIDKEGEGIPIKRWEFVRWQDKEQPPKEKSRVTESWSNYEEGWLVRYRKWNNGTIERYQTRDFWGYLPEKWQVVGG